jgi:hypothetical protein
MSRVRFIVVPIPASRLRKKPLEVASDIAIVRCDMPTGGDITD